MMLKATMTTLVITRVMRDSGNPAANLPGDTGEELVFHGYAAVPMSVAGRAIKALRASS
jgi:hypothetical protein